jgi:hypothetical protein
MTAARHPSVRRRGAILLVVLALLALFAVIGLSFVLYAESEATASRIYREAASQKTPIDVLQRDAASRSIGQLVWGAVDPTSAFRGHDLATLMYGSADGTVPYNGVGLYHENLINIPGLAPNPLNRADVINFTAQRIDPTPAGLATWAIVDPEYTQTTGAVRTGPAVVNPVNLAADPNFVYIPKNAPYTYPDRNNALVGAVDPNTGRVFVPSAHRPGLFHPTAPTAADDWFGLPGLPPTTGANPNWATVSGRFKLLRPRRADQLTQNEVAALKGLGTWPTETPNAAQLAALSDGSPNAVGQFPYPPLNADGSRTGDVQNLRYGAGVQRNDSVWLRYLPATEPASVYKDKKVEPLVAMLLVPLDGRVNLNVAGNLKGAGPSHASNMGFGPHEQNLAAVLQNPAVTSATLVGTKYTPGLDLATGTIPSATAPGGGTLANPNAGAVRVNTKPFLPNPTNLPAPGPRPPSYSRVDWDGSGVANWFTLPGVAPGTGLSSSPAYTLPNSDTAADQTNHPSLWNVFQRPFYQVSDGNAAPPAPATAVPHAYPLTDLKLFAGRYSGSVYDYQNQTFLANANRGVAPNSTPQFAAEFLPTGAGAVANLTRSLVTPFSVSLARPGLGANYLAGGGQAFALAPAVSPVPQLYDPATLGTPTPTPRSPTFQVTAPGVGDQFSDPRANGRVLQNLRAILGGVNLNRTLADYRDPTALNQSLANAASAGLVNLGTDTLAWNDRQQLAADIFIRLCVAAGAKIAFDPFIPSSYGSPSSPLIPPGTKLPYSDNVDRRIQSNNDPNTTFRAGYVLPQPTGFSGTETTYALVTHNAPQPTAPLTTTTTAVSKSEYDAVRWLAQLAANIVDQIDGDDVSTAFVWNPPAGRTGAAPGTPIAPSAESPAPPGLIPSSPVARNQPYDQTANPAAWLNGLDPTFTAGTFVQVEERAVFGVEKPRLVINEVYSEVANDKSNRAGNQATVPFRVRFWVELLNPNNAETPSTALLAGPDVAGPNTANGSVPLVQGTQSVYRLKVYDAGTPVLNQLVNKAGNVKGSVNAADPQFPITTSQIQIEPTAIQPGNPDGLTTADDRGLTCSLLGLTVPTSGTASTTFVEPNGGQPAAAPGGTGRNGFAVVGPNVNTTTHADNVAFAPDDSGTNPFSLAVYKTENPATAATATQPNALDYLVAEVRASDITGGATPLMTQKLNVDPNRHVVLLQRLTNPYLPFDAATNPYVTVDVMSQVQVFDGIRVGNDAANNPDTNNDPVAQNPDQRNAFGRVQPFAGYQDLVAGAGTPAYEYPSANPSAVSPTLTLRQTGITAGTTVNGKDAKLSLFRHNSQTALTLPAPPTVPVTPGGETLLNPFQWLTHFDRPLVNPAELASATAAPAHLLTRTFALPTLSAAQQAASGQAVAFHRNTLGAAQINDAANNPVAISSPPAGQPGALAAANSPLFRALEVLQTKPWTHAVPAAGRVPGKVNINMLWDENPLTGRSRVFDAVLDAAAGNTLKDVDRTAVWQALKATRSPSWANSGTALAPTLPAYGPAVGATLDELPTTFAFPAGTLWPDRPVKGFGAGLFAAAAPGGAFRPNANGQADTLLRPRTHDPITATANNPGVAAGDTLPLFSLGTTTRSTDPNAQHPWVQDEPLRKVLNSFTTTSDSYLLLVTVGFFNVIEETDPANPTGPPVRVLRDEAYDQSPGDLRAQFAAVIDRTGLATDGVNNTTQTAQQPWTLELTEAVPVGGNVAGLLLGATLADVNVPYPPANNNAAGTFNSTAADVAGFGRIMPSISGFAFNPTTSIQTFTVTGNYDGQPVTLTATFNPNLPPANQSSGTFFWLGTGEHAERVEAFFDGTDAGRWSYNPATGAVRLRVRRAGVQQPHEGGSVASNVIFRNPGPQPAKKLSVGQVDPVVRMFVELR